MNTHLTFKLKFCLQNLAAFATAARPASTTVRPPFRAGKVGSKSKKKKIQVWLRLSIGSNENW
jgi:hypothetical protein